MSLILNGTSGLTFNDTSTLGTSPGAWQSVQTTSFAATAGNAYGTNLGSVLNALSGNQVNAAGQLQSGLTSYGGNLANLGASQAGNLITNAGQLQNAYNQYGSNVGNLYSNLLDYVVSAALIFYILTIAGVFVLRRTRPDAERPAKAFGYPVVPALYILLASGILGSLCVYRSSTTFPGIAIVLIGLPVYFLFRRSR